MQVPPLLPSIEPVRRQFLVMTVAIVLCAAASTWLADTLLPQPGLARALVDGAFTLVLLLPVGYLLVAAPVARRIIRGRGAERRLRESEAKYRSLVELSEDLIAIHQHDRVVFINEAGLRLVGASRQEEVIGRGVMDFVPPSYRAIATQRMYRRIEDGKSPVFQTRLLRLDGTEVDIEAITIPFVYHGQTAEQLVVRDISKRKRAEQEQARMQDLLEVSQRLAHLGSWEYEVSTRRLSWSAEMYRIAGIPVGSPVTREVIESFFLPGELERSRENLASVLQGATSYRAEYRVKRSDGQAIVIHNEGEMIFAKDGTPLCIRGTTQDVTSRRREEEALQESRQIIRALLDAIPAGVLWKDTNLVFLGCNTTFANDAGFADPAEIVGKDDYQIGCPAPMADTYREWDRKVITSGQSIRNLEDLHELNGRPVAHLTSRVPLRDSQGKVRGVLGTYVDITERKAAEEALRESEESFRSIVEQSIEGIVVTAGNGAVMEWNHAQERITGLSRGEVVGRPVWEVMAGLLPPEQKTPERIEKLRAGVLELLAGRSAAPAGGRADHAIVLPDATRKLLSENVFVTRRGAEHRIVSIVSDVTQQRKAEEERRRYEQYVQRAQRLDSLGVLAGGIAHDFNNILTSIYGYMELARDSTKESEVADSLSQATASMERAKALTRQLLTFSKGGAPVKRVTDIGALIAETARFATSGSRVKCEVTVAEDLWKCNADRNQVGQVIQNLLLNSIQAMPTGGAIAVAAHNAVLRESEVASLGAGRYVVISVQDDGIGISTEMLPLIFDPFFTTKTQGHGLGLSISHSIVLRHGGAINVHSTLGKGTTFQVFLPASDEECRDAPRSDARPHRGSGRILVMDDEESVLRMVSRMLQAAGYTVRVTASGREALDSYLQERQAGTPFSAVILDLTIPGGLGGKEVAEAIRRVDGQTPLFVASGYAEDEILAHPGEYGFTASISKPFRAADLVAMLETHVAQGAPRA